MPDPVPEKPFITLNIQVHDTVSGDLLGEEEIRKTTDESDRDFMGRAGVVYAYLLHRLALRKPEQTHALLNAPREGKKTP